jgi:phospholipase C
VTGTPRRARGGVDRRTFLRRAGMVAGGAAAAGGVLAACSGKSPTTTFDSVIDHPAKESRIDTVVVLTMENRSFDHLVGWLATDDGYLELGRRRHGGRFRVDGRQDLHYRDPEGRTFATSLLTTNPLEPDPWRGCTHPIPGHGWNSGRAQLAHGFLGENSGNDEYAIGYFRGDDVPFTRLLAQRFSVFDHWHAPLMAGTFPNRQYLHSATSDGRKEDPIPLRVGIYPGPTIWDRLTAAHVDAGYYHVDLPIISLWGRRMDRYRHPIDDYFTDAAAGTLPNFVMVDPGFQGAYRTDDHSWADIRYGQRFVREVFRSFASSPQWERGVFVLIYDEWGGFFDHVVPPVVPDDRRSPDPENDFGQTGFRVPAIVASPRARHTGVDHTVSDHTSVLRFLEWRFLGAPGRGPGGGAHWSLSRRDRHAHNLGAVLGAGKATPDLGFDVDLHLVAGSGPCPPPTPGGTPPPGSAVGDSSEWVADEELQSLTRPSDPDVSAAPWLLP